MEQITEKTGKEERNAWGQVSTVYRQRFLIESSDMGICRDHYTGHNHRKITFNSSHIGQTIEVLTDGKSLWTCWTFV